MEMVKQNQIGIQEVEKGEGLKSWDAGRKEETGK